MVNAGYKISQTKRAADKMSTYVNQKLGPILADIGGEMARIVGGNPDGTYLYAEAGTGWYGASVFKDEGTLLRYYDPSQELSHLIYEAWLSEEPDRRWSTMEYQITGTNFDAKFRYPDEIPVQSFAADGRREVALKKRFGDKPVIYPPIPEHLLNGSAKKN